MKSGEIMERYFVTDLHSHVLFGIDDGATTIEESIEMLKMAEKQGVKNVFCTSHHWQSESKKYEFNFSMLKDRVKREGLDIKLYKGMEILCEDDVFFSETIKDIKRGAVKALNDSDYLLVEISPFMSTQEIFNCINTIFEQTKKKVILAHVERYRVLHNEDKVLGQLKTLGCLFQINAYSLVKEKSNSIRNFARKLLSDQLVDFIGSDAHKINHRPPELLSGVDYIYTSCDKEYADAVCFKNAERLLLNERI